MDKKFCAEQNSVESKIGLNLNFLITLYGNNLQINGEVGRWEIFRF